MDNLQDDNKSNNNTTVIIIIIAATTIILIMCCIGLYFYYRHKKKRNQLNKIEDNLSYKTFDDKLNQSDSIASHDNNTKNNNNNNSIINHESISLAANRMLDSDNLSHKKSFKNIHHLDLQKWELRTDPTSKMKLLYNRIEHKNYWPWKYPEIAKSLGLIVPNKSIFKKLQNNDNNDNKIPLIPPPPPSDAVDNPVGLPPPDVDDINDNQQIASVSPSDAINDNDNGMGLPPPDVADNDNDVIDGDKTDNQQIPLIPPPPPPAAYSAYNEDIVSVDIGVTDNDKGNALNDNNSVGLPAPNTNDSFVLVGLPSPNIEDVDDINNNASDANINMDNIDEPVLVMGLPPPNIDNTDIIEDNAPDVIGLPPPLPNDD